MKTIWTTLACACVALALAGGAGAVSYGVTEDGAKDASFFDTLTDLGLTENRVSVAWNPATPNQLDNQAQLDWLVPEAAIHGIQIVISVAPAHPTDITGTRSAPGQFASFLQFVARRYPTVKDYVVGNEPNQPRFWQPQFIRGVPVAGATYEPVLARSYDALKAVDPSINVIGLGLSPRGNDNPLASSNVSTSPVRFLHDLGVAYRKSKRVKPLMDELAFHPYPQSNTDPPTKGTIWPNGGLVNLDRIKQAAWDSFGGTGQPTFAEPGNKSKHPLTLDLDEVGWQVSIPASVRSFYHGQETAITIDDATQARYDVQAVKLVSCDPGVRVLSFFHLYDETDLDRWQSGLIRADGYKRPAYAAVKNAVANSACTGPAVAWRHTTIVAGAKTTFGKKQTLVVTTQEEATFRAAIIRLPARGTLSRAAIKRTLLAASSPRRVLKSTGTITAYRRRFVAFPPRRLKHGRYVLAVTVAATMNPARTSLAFGKPFRR
ncbi:MAG: hypothetical protein WBB74_00965 [Gaiellaceae bacterium]